MPDQSDLSWYASPSAVTDAGQLGPVLDDIPSRIEGMREVAQSLVIHYRADRPLAAGVPRERLSEIDSRYGERMLTRLRELKAGSLTESRRANQRLVGCCRDFTVLFLTMARARQVPARARVGFASYFLPHVWIDHELAEVWDEDEGRWRLVDAQLREDYVDETDGRAIDALDVPRDRFLVAGAAWQLCRAGEANPEKFECSSGTDGASPTSRPPPNRTSSYWTESRGSRRAPTPRSRSSATSTPPTPGLRCRPRWSAMTHSVGRRGPSRSTQPSSASLSNIVRTCSSTAAAVKSSSLLNCFSAARHRGS